MLIRLLKERRIDGGLRGYVTADGERMMSQLMYDDDTILWCKATNSKVSKMLSGIREYSEPSGECVNFDKSGIFW